MTISKSQKCRKSWHVTKRKFWQENFDFFFDFWKAKLSKKISSRKFLTLRRLGVNISCIDDSSFLKCTFRIRYQRSLKFLIKLRNWSNFWSEKFWKKIWNFFWTEFWGFADRTEWFRTSIGCRKWPVLIIDVNLTLFLIKSLKLTCRSRSKWY